MKEFKTKLKVDATAEEVYSAITNPFAIELWTGYPAVMSTEPGSEFELCEGDICGKNLEFKENEMVRQEWYFGDEGEPSIATIYITARSKSKSEIYVKHTNIPDEFYENISEGWKEDYLEALRRFLEEGEDE